MCDQSRLTLYGNKWWMCTAQQLCASSVSTAAGIVIILSFGSYCCFPFFVNPGLIGEEIPPTCTLNSHVDETLVHVHVGCMQQSTKYDPSYSAGPQEVCFKPQI